MENGPAALLGEQLVAEVVQHGAVEHVGAHAEPAAGLPARPAGGAAVVVPVRCGSGLVALARRLELVALAALAAPNQPAEDLGARRPPSLAGHGVSLSPDLLGGVEQPRLDQRRDRCRDVLGAVTLGPRSAVDSTPHVLSGGHRVVDDAEHTVPVPTHVAVRDTALVEDARDRLRPPPGDVQLEHLSHELGFQSVGHEAPLGLAARARDVLDGEPERRLRTVEVPLPDVLLHRGTGAGADDPALVLVEQLVNALHQLAVGVVCHLLLDGEHAHAVLAQLALVPAGQLDVAHEPARVDDHDRAGLVRRAEQRLDHALELGARIVGRGRAPLDELGDDEQIALLGVGSDGPELRVERHAVGLLGGGDADVGDDPCNIG